MGQEEHGSFLFLLKSFLFSHHQQILSKTFPRLTQSGEGWYLRFVGAAQSVVQTKKIVLGRDNIREPKLPLALFSARSNFGSQMLFCHDILSWGARSCLEHLEASQHKVANFSNNLANF